MSIAEGDRSRALARRTAAAAAAALLALFVIRTALVAAYAERAPALAAKAWPGHPDVALSIGFAQIGAAAALGRTPPQSAFAAVAEASRKAPLAAEPFLVRGVQAQVDGNLALAERAFREAERRNPRSRAAHFFLADLYVRTGRVGDGLRQISVLTRLLPGTGGTIAPYLAQFARSPGAASELRKLFAEEPDLAPVLLGELAKDAGNADLVVALAEGRDIPGSQEWRAQIVDALVRAGEFARAREAWSRLNGVPAPSALFDPEFRGSAALPPFNWSFASGPGGLAEPRDGRLQVIFYGREATVLAGQVLTLEPGRYRLAMRLGGGSHGRADLAWRLTCLPANRAVAELPLDRAGPNGGFAAELEVPAGCPGQRLELVGKAPDVPRQAEVEISGLGLSRIPRP